MKDATKLILRAQALVDALPDSAQADKSYIRMLLRQARETGRLEYDLLHGAVIEAEHKVR